MTTIPYASAIGSLIYAMVCTWPYIAFAVGVFSRFVSNPGEKHWDVVKWLLRYLKGTSGMGLCFWQKGVKFEGYVDTSKVRMVCLYCRWYCSELDVLS